VAVVWKGEIWTPGGVFRVASDGTRAVLWRKDSGEVLARCRVLAMTEAAEPSEGEPEHLGRLRKWLRNLLN